MSILTRSAPPPERRYSDPNLVPRPADAAALPYIYRTTDAMKIAAVVACVGLRAGALAQIPMKGYRDGDAPIVLSPQPELLTAPSTNRVIVPSIWKTQMSISRDVWGYAVGRIRGVDAAGYVSKVDWVCPDDTYHDQEYSGGPLRWKFLGEPVDSSLVFHVPSRWVLPGNPAGISPLEYSGLVDLAKRAQDFGRDWFRNGAVPSSILYSDQEITANQADDMLSRLTSRWRRRQPGVLGSGLRFEQVSVAANESQFIETMQRAAADIAISFNLPPSKIAAAVASGGDIKYQNLEMSTQQYLMDSINPDLVVIQEVMGLYRPSSEYVRWQTGAFLRADLKTRYESYEIGKRSGFLVNDEIRDWEELGPMPADANVDPRNLAEMIQKIYLGVGVVLSDEEARQIINQAGGNLPGGLPQGDSQ